MNRNDPDFEKALRAIDRFYATQVNICIAALNSAVGGAGRQKHRLRAIMCDMPDQASAPIPRPKTTASILGRPGGSMWTRRRSPYVTQAEGNVLWNVGRKAETERLAVPQQRITVRADGISRPRISR